MEALFKHCLRTVQTLPMYGSCIVQELFQVHFKYWIHWYFSEMKAKQNFKIKNARHRHICTCAFCRFHDFWIYVLSKILDIGILFHRIHKYAFFPHEPNECGYSTCWQCWRTFHTVRKCEILFLNDMLKKIGKIKLLTSNFLSSHEKAKIWLKSVELFIWKWRILQYYFFQHIIQAQNRTHGTIVVCP